MAVVLWPPDRVSTEHSQLKDANLLSHEVMQKVWTTLIDRHTYGYVTVGCAAVSVRTVRTFVVVYCKAGHCLFIDTTLCSRRY